MTGRPGPAAAEERAELQVLRDQAEAAGRDVAGTLAALSDRLAAAADPGTWVRRRLAAARARARRAGRQAVGRAAGSRAAGTRQAAGSRQAALAGAAAAIIVMTATAAWIRKRQRSL